MVYSNFMYKHEQEMQQGILTEKARKELINIIDMDNEYNVRNFSSNLYALYTYMLMYKHISEYKNNSIIRFILNIHVGHFICDYNNGYLSDNKIINIEKQMFDYALQDFKIRNAITIIDDFSDEYLFNPEIYINEEDKDTVLDKYYYIKSMFLDKYAPEGLKVSEIMKG